MRAFPWSLLYLVFGISLCPLYSNTLLANLNARAYIRGEAVTQNVGSDLVTASSPASDDTKADKQSGETKFISPAHQVSFIIRAGRTVMRPDDDCAVRAFGKPRRW